jgi:hypothetical protein
MKKLELILAAMSIIAFIMKTFLLPWSGPILTFSMMGLCLTYMTSVYLYQDTTNFKQLYKSMIATPSNIKYFGRGFAIIIIASLFKLCFWGQSNMLFIAGFIVIATNLVINYFRKSKSHMKIITQRIIIICGIGCLVYLTPENTIIDIHFGNNPEYAELLKKNFKNPENKEIQKKLYKLQKEIYK